jgi:hypothetical protein
MAEQTAAQMAEPMAVSWVEQQAAWTAVLKAGQKAVAWADCLVVRSAAMWVVRLVDKTAGERDDSLAASWVALMAARRVVSKADSMAEL